MLQWPYDVLKKRIYQIEKYDEAYKAEMDRQKRDAEMKAPSPSRVSTAKIKSFR